MDVLDFLRVIAPRCRLLGTPAEALAVLPDLGVDAPGLVPLPLAAGPVPVMPIAFAEALRRPLANAVLDRLGPLVRGEGGEGLGDITPEVLRKDSLVRLLARLLLEASGLGVRSCSLVMLEFTRQSAMLANAQLDELRAEAPELASRLRPPLDALQGLDAAALARVLAALSWSLSARLAAAWSLAGQVDDRLRPTRLYQAIARNGLALVVPRDGLDLPADLEFAARVAGNPAEPGVLAGAQLAIRTAARVVLELRGATLNPVQRGLRDLAGERRDPQVLSFDPRVADWALHGLKDLVTPRELSDAGVPRHLADPLLRGDGVGPLATSYTQLCATLREWDLLSTLAASVLPVEGGPGAFRTPMGPLTGPGPWGLLGPRGAAGVQTASVVVVRPGQALVELAKLAQQTNNPSLVGALERRWTALSGEAWASGGACGEGLGSVGLWIAAFPHLGEARAFSKRVAQAFAPPIRLANLEGEELVLPTAAEVDIQVREGLCFGGWTGQSLHIWGPAVEEALGVPRRAAEPEDQRPAELRAALDALAVPAGAAADPFAAAEAPPRHVAAVVMPGPAPGRGGAKSPPVGPGHAPAATAGPAAATAPPPAPSRAAPPPAPSRAAPPPAPSRAAPPAQPHSPLPPLPADPFALDPLDAGAGETLSPNVVGWEEDLSAARGSLDLVDPFTEDAPSDPFTSDLPTPSPRDTFVSVEIEDDDDSHVSDPGLGTDQAEMFYLPPPVPTDPSADDEGELDEVPEDLLGELLEDALDLPSGGVSPGARERARAAPPAPIPEVPRAIPAPPDRPARPERARPGITAAELGFLFEGYVLWTVNAQHFVFGRRYGAKIVDAHEYRVSGLAEAYQQFAADKVREGFAPRTELTRDAPPEQRLNPLNLEAIAEALRALA